MGNAGIDEASQSAIDHADVVIRFNNYANRNIIHTKDKLRCDILFSTFDLHSAGSDPRDVVIGIPFPFKAHEIESKPERWYPNARPWMVNPYENMKMCRELHAESMGFQHPFPSIGCTALWHMQDWDADFYVCGFSWYSSLKEKTIQGVPMNATPASHKKIWNHNYFNELQWIIKTLVPKNNIIFSESCQEIISVYSKYL